MTGIDWLNSLATEATFTPQDRTLETMQVLMAALGHPERSYRVIHITGTAGKGSVAEFITRILVAAGYRVGTYGSPHVYRLNERIRIDGEEVSNERLSATLRDVHLRSVAAEVQPRWFEALTAAAFVIFREESNRLLHPEGESAGWRTNHPPGDPAAHQPFIVVVEVGLGGRLDSTNVFDQPALTIVTSIGLDHQDFLGETEAGIARDKAGIFRPAVPALIGDVSDAARTVLTAEAHRIGAPLIQLPKLDIQLPAEPSLIGPHQISNAKLAVAAIRQLGEVVVRDEAIAAGLQSAHLPGRFEILSTDPFDSAQGLRPLVIFDVAHNPMKIAALVDTIGHPRARTPQGWRRAITPLGCSADWGVRPNFTTLVGIKADKDAAAILRLLDHITDRYVFVNLPDVPHWAPADLAELTKKTSSLELDWNRESPLLITGSFHLGGIAKRLTQGRISRR